ncbi:polysaccharide biosynthesis tyrosine autokinase [Burkholderia sp. AW49-1]
MDNPNIFKQFGGMPESGRDAASGNADDEIDLVAFLDIVIGHRLAIIWTVIAFLVLACVYLVVASPKYEAYILVQVEDNLDSSAKNLLGDVSSLFDVKSSSDAEIQILGSRMIVGQAVDNLALFIDATPRYLPLFGRWIANHAKRLPVWAVPRVPGFASGNERIVVSRFEVPRDFEDDKFTLTALGSGAYRLEGRDLDRDVTGRIGVTQHIDSPGGPLELHVDTLTGAPGTQYVLRRHSRLETVNDMQQALIVAEQGKQSGVISVSWQSRDPQRVADVMNEIARLYLKQNVERKSAEAQKSLDFLDQQVPIFRKQLEDSERRYNAMRIRLGSIDIDTEAKLALQAAADVKTKLLELKQQRSMLAARYASTHPDVIAVDQQIAVLDAQEQESRRRIAQLPEREQDIVSLTRDVQVNTGLYTALLNNVQQLRLLKAGKVGNVRLIDSAVVPDDPVKPKKLLVLVAAVLGGLFAGVALAFARARLFDGISDPHEIESRAGLPVYATIPFSDKEKAGMTKRAGPHGTVPLLAACNPEEPAIESLRSLRTALQFALCEAKNNVILLTSAAPGAGKSFVSANLAAVLASGGMRVMLIDADLRAGRLHRHFGGIRQPGLSELIAGTVAANDVLRRDVTPNLDFIPCGSVPPAPAELLLSGKFGKIVDGLMNDYDVVIIDTAPVLAVADTGIIAKQAGSVFVVGRAGVTKLGEVTETDKRLKMVGVPVKGVVLNALVPRAGRYAYGDKYGTYRHEVYAYNANARGTASKTTERV